MITGKCKLCLKKKELVDSHIFPEFMFKSIYDDKHEFILLSSSVKFGRKRKRKGIHESLLCLNCDQNIIGKYEDYAAKIINGDGKKYFNVEKTFYGIKLININYNLFKLFQLSLIWRASISTNPDLSPISLGPHEDTIRKMLILEKPGKFYDYGAILCYFPLIPQKLKEIIIPPFYQAKMECHRVYPAIFNGLIYLFYSSNHLNNAYFNTYFLQENGELPLIDLQNIGEDYFVKTVKGIMNETINKTRNHT